MEHPLWTAAYTTLFSTQITGARVHSVIFIISLKLNIFPFSASIITLSTQNHLILTYFTHFDTTHFFFYKYYNINIVPRLTKIPLIYRNHPRTYRNHPCVWNNPPRSDIYTTYLGSYAVFK